MKKSTLCATTALQAFALLGMGLAATPAFAQTTPTPAPTAPEADEAAAQTDPNAPAPGQPAAGTAVDTSGEEVITVTGSILRQTTTETPSPVTVLSAETLQQRGINTVAEATQRLSANNAGTIQQGWNTGFNFASGANAPALRGLTVQATLSIADGLRLAPYPLADDGQRNFVDLNTIPNAVVDRIEVLRDGASSTYGADAIAGVINIITKKEIQGLHLGASAGISQRGDAGERRIDATWGYGDLDDQGFNFYVSGEYQKQDSLWARDRGYPFNSADLSGICGDSGSCLHNGNWNGLSEDGNFNGNISIPGVALVRPSNAASTNGAGQFQLLNPAAGCREWPEVDTTGVGGTAPTPFSCEVDFQNRYIMLQPEIERKGISGRLTFNIGDNHQLYAMGNWYTTKSFASFTPLGFNGTPTPPIPATLTAYNVMMPIYVCPTGVGTPTGLNTGCDALTPGSILNPYNPFATGDPLTDDTAQMFIRSTRPRTVETKSRALRGALGVSGSFWNDVRYNVEATASQVQLDRTQSGYLIPQRIMNLVARGAFNFFDIESNSEELWDYISPDQKVRSVSDLWQVSGTLAKDLFELPGGPLQAAVGLSYRHESINAPSANPAINNELGVPDPLANQYERYYSINSVEAVGSRNVKSAFFEVGAPILDQLEVNLSGRFDKYSTGQSNFSPKIGAKFTPIKELAIRGTFSKGFRIPSFNEAFGLPTTGYVGRGGVTFCDDGAHADFCDAHSVAGVPNAYATGAFPLGLTQVGNPQLDPEKSTAFTAGIVFEPIRNVAFTVDFWNIKVKDLISGLVDSSPIFEAYYANNGVVTGFPGITVLPGQPDPAFPAALPHIGFIQSPFQNQGSQITRGIDFGVNSRMNITDGIRWISSGDASYMLKYELTDADGNKFRYDGTLSPCNITSCSGAPKWRFSWQNSFEFGDTTLTGTLYYTSGYDNASIDFGGIKGDCEASIGGSVVAYPDGTPVRCKAKPTWNFDFTANQKINDKLSVYMNVLNLFDIDAPFDPSGAYSLFQFNPAWAGPNIMGRYFRVGAKVDF
jgi:iron complex outermembrane receptor protein